LLAILADLGPSGSVSVALSILEGGYPIEVRFAALDVLARHADDHQAAKLLDLYSTSPISLRPRIRDVLLSRPGTARAFLERVDNRAIAASDVPLDQLRQVTLHGNPKLDALVRKHWGSIQPGTAEEKLAEIRRLSNDLRAEPGDRARGRALFLKHCATCHKLFGEKGGEVGPDLTGVARNDLVSLLANIVDPSAVIRAPFLQYIAVTTSGRVATGIIAAQDNASMTFIDARNARTTLSRNEIDQLRELPASIMPENLLKLLTSQEVRDLFSYLQAKGP
jgi:putative heme-binding domain-containing protein